MRISDWSSDVFSSDLQRLADILARQAAEIDVDVHFQHRIARFVAIGAGEALFAVPFVEPLERHLPGIAETHVILQRPAVVPAGAVHEDDKEGDRKSTRLNSSH